MSSPFLFYFLGTKNIKTSPTVIFLTHSRFFVSISLFAAVCVRICLFSIINKNRRDCYFFASWNFFQKMNKMQKVSEKLMDGAAAMGFRDRSKRRSSLPVSSLSNRRRSSSASAGSTSCKPQLKSKQTDNFQKYKMSLPPHRNRDAGCCIQSFYYNDMHVYILKKKKNSADRQLNLH